MSKLEQAVEVVYRIGEEQDDVLDTVALSIMELGVDYIHEVVEALHLVMSDLGGYVEPIAIAEVIEALTSHGLTTKATIEGSVALGYDRAVVVAEVRRQLVEWDTNSLEWWLVEEGECETMINRILGK